MCFSVFHNAVLKRKINDKFLLLIAQWEYHDMYVYFAPFVTFSPFFCILFYMEYQNPVFCKILKFCAFHLIANFCDFLNCFL